MGLGLLTDGFSLFESLPSAVVLSSRSVVSARFEDEPDRSVSGFWNWNFCSLFLVAAETEIGFGGGFGGTAPEWVFDLCHCPCCCYRIPSKSSASVLVGGGYGGSLGKSMFTNPWKSGLLREGLLKRHSGHLSSFYRENKTQHSTG